MSIANYFQPLTKPAAPLAAPKHAPKRKVGRPSRPSRDRFQSFHQLETANKKTEEADKFKCVAPLALQKLRGKNMDFTRLTIVELRAVAYEYLL